MAAPRTATSIRKNTPPSSRVNYGDHYLLSAILSEIDKRGGVTSVEAEIQKQNKRGIIERTGFNIGVYRK